jgi:hypothetical protein
MPPTLKKRRQTPDPLPPGPALSLSNGPALSLSNGPALSPSNGPALSLSKTRRRAPTRFWVRPGHPDLDRAGDLLLAEASGWRRESVSRGLAR